MKRKRGKTGFQALTVAALSRKQLAELLVHFEQLHRDVDELARQVAELRALGERMQAPGRASRRKVAPPPAADPGDEERRATP
jgi:hypothetical protein